MKRTIVLLAVATASMIAIAQPPQNPTPATSPASPAPPPASVTPSRAAVTPTPPPMVKKESAQVPTSGFSTPLKYFTKPLVKEKVESVDGMSSRPWTQIVGIRPGYSAFPPPELHQSTLYLFWVGRDPH